jgi:hypothetical protein
MTCVASSVPVGGAGVRTAACGTGLRAASLTRTISAMIAQLATSDDPP